MSEANRLPLEEAITAARLEARRREYVRQTAMRHLTEIIIDDLENQILAAADDHGISDRTSFLEFVEVMMGNRVLERRLTP
jgi:hypothetical protein